MVARTFSTTVTREQIDAAFSNLGRLEGLARFTDDNAIALGDSIAQVLHYASIMHRRKNSRKSTKAYEKAQIERHETEEVGMALLSDQVMTALYGSEYGAEA